MKSSNSKGFLINIIITIICGLIVSYLVYRLGWNQSYKEISSIEIPIDQDSITGIESIAESSSNTSDNKPNNIEKLINVSIKVILDTDFKNADFFLDGDPVYPVKNLPLIKIFQFKVSISTRNFFLLVKSETRICKKNIILPPDFINNPEIIEVICTSSN